MARLFDRLLANGSWTLDSLHMASPGASAVQVLVADNVAEYFFAASGQEWWNADDFPNVAPPFPSFWVEATKPSRIFSDELGVRHVGRTWPTNFGALFMAKAVDELSATSKALIPGDSRWAVSAMLYHEYRNLPAKREFIAGPVAVVSFGVRANGTIAKMDGGTWRSVVVPSRKHDRAQLALLADDAMVFLNPLLLAVSFLHCKNVDARPVDQPARLSKKWEEEHGRALVRYHVLDIDPMRKVLRDEGGAETHGLQKALHICRGHFMTYTEEAPLFGKLTGTFWRESHVRGSLNRGITLKDYNVKAPQ